MFLLRCAFWLSVVYASMSWGGTVFQHHGSFEAATRGEPALLDGGVVGRAAAGAADVCRGREVDCVRDAAMLTALVRKTLRNDDDATPAGSDVSSAPEELVVQAEAPRPVPDPRRRDVTRVLTRLP